MSIKTRKGIRPAFLAAALGVVAMLAVAAAMMLPSGSAQAQGTNPFLPAVPMTVVAAVDSASQVTLRWASGDERTSEYEVQRESGDGMFAGIPNKAHSGTATTFVDDTVSAATYTYRVRATNAFGNSNWSVPSNAVTVTDPGNGGGNGNGGTNVGQGSATKPSAPAMMSISRATDNQARSVLPGDGKLMIKWGYPNDGGTPITGFDVRYTMTPADDDSWQIITDLPAGKTSYVLMGLANGETYYVQVRAKNRLGNSAWSARRSGMPVATPSMPMELSVADHNSLPGIVVSWDAPASSGDHPIDQYNWDVDDMADNGRDSYGTFGSRALRDPTPPRMQMFFPERGGAITTSVAADDYGCLKVTVSASNATGPDSESSSRTRTLPGDEAMVTCAGAPTLTKQIVDNVVILRWDKPANLGGGTEVTEYVVRRWGYERISPNHDDTPGPHLSAEYREWHLDGSQMSMWDTGLSHQTIYRYRIYAITDRYDLGYESDRYDVSDAVTAFTSTDGGLILAPPTAPSAPRSLNLSADCDDKITLGWAVPAELGGGVNVNLNRHWNHGMIVVEDDATIDSYDVQYREVGTAVWKDLTAVGTTAELTSGLTHGKTYEFRVRATNSVGLTGPWATKSLELPPAVEPHEPTALRGEPNDLGHIVLAWTPPVDADYYNDAGQILAHGSKGDRNRDGIINLTAGETVDEGTPLWRRPEDKDANDMSKKLAYLIERRNADGDWMSLLTMPQKHEYSPEVTFGAGDDSVKEQTYTDENPPMGQQSIDYRVAAIVEECAQSDWDTKLVNVAATPPSVPQSVNASVTGTTATITWLAPADSGRIGSALARITGYQIQRNGVEDYRSVGPTVTSIQDTGLAGSTTYTYQVRAMSASGTSVWSTAVSVTTASQALGNATGLSATVGADAGTVQLSWTAGANSTRHYLAGVKVSDWRANDFTNVIFRATAGNSADTVTGLDSGEQYAFTVLSGNATSWHATWSNIVYVTPN